MLTTLIAMAFLTVKPSTADILRDSWKETLVVGHRGAAAYEKENTLPSFEAAIGSGAVATECDIHLSKDRQMIVMHDATVDRTSALHGAVKDLDAATMKAAGIPTLPQLTALTKGRIVLVVEIKEGDGIEKMMVDHLKQQDMVAETIAFGFSSERIGKVKELNPMQVAVWLVADPSDPEKMFATLKEIHADGFGVQYKNTTPELAKMARDRHIPLFVWTVPPGPEVDRLKAMRVNFIITNHPRDVSKQLAGN